MPSWVKTNYQRMRTMSFREQIKYNFSLPYWRLVGYLARKGFFWTEQGCYVRLRDFTLKFWKVLLLRQGQTYIQLIESQDARIADLETKVCREQTRLVICLAEVVQSVGGEVNVTPETMRASLSNRLESSYDPETKIMTYKVVNGTEASIS
jgi:hypothetical protein